MFSVFELHFCILYWFKASEFNEKKEKTLKHLDDLTALNRSVDVRDKREVQLHNASIMVVMDKINHWDLWFPLHVFPTAKMIPSSELLKGHFSY